MLKYRRSKWRTLYVDFLILILLLNYINVLNVNYLNQPDKIGQPSQRNIDSDLLEMSV